jgi:hypothetical protein
MMMADFHPQVTIAVGTVRGGSHVPDEFQVDAELVGLIEWLNTRQNIRTYESCQNYGEYLRELGFDHTFESKRDYAYIEFYDLDDARGFLNLVKEATGVTHMIYHRIVQEGTPGAWELKARPSIEDHFWVWLPVEDIPELEEVLGANV